MRDVDEMKCLNSECVFMILKRSVVQSKSTKIYNPAWQLRNLLKALRSGSG